LNHQQNLFVQQPFKKERRKKGREQLHPHKSGNVDGLNACKRIRKAARYGHGRVGE